MSNLYGFKTGGLRELVSHLNAVRSGAAPLNPGGRKRPQDISLSDYLKKTKGKFKGAKLSQIYQDFEIEEASLVEDVWEKGDAKHLFPEIIRAGFKRGQSLSRLSEGEYQRRKRDIEVMLNTITSNRPTTATDRWLVPEQFLEAQRTGAIKRAYYEDLIIRKESVNTQSPKVPFIDIAAAQTRIIAEGETKPKGKVSASSKQVELSKYSTGLGVTFETVRRVSINWLSLFFEDAGRRHMAKKNGNLATTLINGDTADLAYAAAVIGVEDTTPGFTYYDLIRVLVYMADLGFSAQDILAGKAMAVKLLNITEIKNNQNAGGKLVQVNPATPIPTNFNLYTTSKVPANKLIFQDSQWSLIEAYEQALTLQSREDITTDIFESYMTEWSGFVKFRRDASVIVDQSILYSGNQFPAFMEPLED